MDWTTYINSLEKITIQDIAPIIRERLDKKDEFSLYGFREQRNVVLFGEYMGGFIPNPYLLMYDQEDNMCEKFYDMLQSEFPNVFQYSYVHYLTGEYDYLGITDNLNVCFPNLCTKDQEWIINQVYNDEKGESKTR